MSRVLLTGFEPFGGLATNASWEVVSRVVDVGRGVEVAREQLPVVFDTALDQLRGHLRLHRPDLVICVGQAGGREGISLERVAINVMDASIPDNAGERPIDVPIVSNGPVGYWSSLPLKAIVDALGRRGLPASVSQTAGTYLCNQVFYGLMRSLARRPGVRGGFVHVPFLPEQAVGPRAAAPSLSLEAQVRALEITVRTALSRTDDLEVAGGATH